MHGEALMANRGLVPPLGLSLLVIAVTVWDADGKILAQEPSQIDAMNSMV